jgi:hypothetical protein
MEIADIMVLLLSTSLELLARTAESVIKVVLFEHATKRPIIRQDSFLFRCKSCRFLPLPP